jgi:hypothetical protein
MTAVKPGQVRAMAERFRRVLSAEMAERGNRLDVDDFGDGCETWWAWCERQRMFDEVNRACAEQGLDSVSYEDVKRVEQMAIGHVDYFTKFSWYCAELALGVKEPRP